MSAYDRAIYQRARAANYPASASLAIARSVARDVDVPEYGAPISFAREGFDIVASLDYDDLELDDLGYGTFYGFPSDYRRLDIYSEYGREPNLGWPNAVRNPYRDDRNASGGAAWYVPGMAGSLAERKREYSRMGYSRSMAMDMARESVEDELRRVTDDYGPSVYVVTVIATRHGIELGRAVLGGVECTYDPVTRDYGRAYLWGTIEEMVPEAIAEARANLSELVTEVV